MQQLSSASLITNMKQLKALRSLLPGAKCIVLPVSKKIWKTLLLADTF